MQKYFVISLHRTGSRSVDSFFSDLGHATLHWPSVVAGVDYQKKITGHESDLQFICEALFPVIADHDVLSDVPFPGLFRELAVIYPNAKFILFYRNAFDWVKSVRAHYVTKTGVLQPFVLSLYWQYFSDRPTNLNELSDRDMLMMHAGHFADVLAFFKDTPERLCVVNMDDSNIGEVLSHFSGITGTSRFPHLGGWQNRSKLAKLSDRWARKLVGLRNSGGN